MKKILFAAVLGGMMAFSAAHAEKVIRVGTDPTYAPFEAYNKQGKLEGIDYDFGEAICKEIGAKCKWIQYQFDSLIPALQAQKIDIALSSMSITKDREKVVAFTQPLYATTIRLIVNKNSPDLASTAEALKGKIVGAQAGTIMEKYAKKFWEGKGVTVQSYANDDLAKQDLSLGRIDAVLDDTSAAEGFFETPEGKNFKFTGNTLYDTDLFGVGIGISMNKNNTQLLKEFNQAIDQMHKDGTYEKIMNKYKKYGIIPPKK